MARKTYTPVKQEDGTFKIEAVEIFMLGKSKGKDYTREWFDRALANHNQFRDEKGYLPSVKIGHDSFLDSEKPEIAAFDNLRLAEDGVTVLCDYIVEDAGAFGTFNKFPHRSVEVYHEAAHLSRVAQLGGSEPYFKLPPLRISQPELFGMDEEPEIVVFDDGEEPIQFDAQSDSPTPTPFSVHGEGLGMGSESELEAFRAERDAALQKQAELEAELAVFRAQAKANTRKSETELLDQRKKHFQNSGIAKPVIDLYFDLRRALLFADNPLDCTVKFDHNGTPVEKSFPEALDDFENLLFKHATNQTLVVHLNGHNLPIQETEPKLHAESQTEDQVQAEQVSALKQYFANKGQESWTNEEYRLARIELGYIKP